MSDLIDNMHKALFEVVIKDEPNTMVSKWIVVAEVINADGEPALWSMCSPRLPVWDRIGLAEFYSRCLNVDGAFFDDFDDDDDDS